MAHCDVIQPEVANTRGANSANTDSASASGVTVLTEFIFGYDGKVLRHKTTLVLTEFTEIKLSGPFSGPLRVATKLHRHQGKCSNATISY